MNHVENAVHDVLVSQPHLETMPPDTLNKIIQAFEKALPVILEIISLFHTSNLTPPGK